MVLKKMNGTLLKIYRAPSNSSPKSTKLTRECLILDQSHCASGHCTFEGGLMSWFDPDSPCPPKALSINVSEPFKLFPNILDWPLGHWPTSYSISQTLVCPYTLSLPDTLDSPCLHFYLQPLTLTWLHIPNFQTPSLTAI